MNILAIRFARLGDIVLLMPALISIKESLPHARLTLLTDNRWTPLAEMCPAIDAVISADRLAMRDGSIWRAANDVRRLVLKVRSGRFDVVADFHGFRETNLLTWLSGAKVRLGMRRSNAGFFNFCFNRPPVEEDKALHVAEMFQQVASALPGVQRHKVEGQTIRIPEAVQHWVQSAGLPRPQLALYVDAPVADRRWPPEFFAAVADHAAESLGAYSVVLSSPSNAGAAERVRSVSRHPDKLRVFANLTLLQLAAVIQSSRLLISNDTGPMHLGPALGVPTLGLFSVGLPEHFRPVGNHDRFLRNAAIEGISVEEVIQQMTGMWTRIADRGLRR